MMFKLTPVVPNNGGRGRHGLTVQDFVSFLLTTPIQFGLGRKFYVGGYKALKHGRANMDVLVAGGTTTAYVASVVLVLLRMSSSDDSFEPMVYFDAAAMLITFILLGKFLEAYTKGKTSEAMYKLMDLQAKTALIVPLDDSGEPTANETEVDVALLKMGDCLKVLPGSTIPADGEIYRGFSSINESMVTGESMPVDKAQGATVIGGTINVGARVFFMKVTKTGSDTMLAQICKMIDDAQTSKAPIQVCLRVVCVRVYLLCARNQPAIKAHGTPYMRALISASECLFCAL